ncbi:MAG: 4Fe-4S binding protein [Marinilabiliales bacterium]|nr:4Fe-4S binding protein [Marinilabiliales bacterium]
MSSQRVETGSSLVDCDAEAPDDLLFFQAEKISESDVTHQVPVINKDACTWCGRCSKWCNYNAIFYLPSAQVIEVIENLCHGCGACTFACNAGAITEKPVSLGTVYFTTKRPAVHHLLKHACV